jgi:hypothetical protein
MADNNQELARDLGFLEAYTIGVGTIIGAGIFVLPSIVAASAGPAGMISFTIGGVVSLLTALSLSEPLPDKYRKRLRTSNMIERFIEEIRRREKPIRIFPNERSVWRLIGALCAEKHEEWSTGRRYLKMEEFYRWKTSHQEPASEPEPLPIAA